MTYCGHISTMTMAIGQEFRLIDVCSWKNLSTKL